MGTSFIHRDKTVTKAGFHLKPKYDLVYLRRRRAGKGKSEASGELPLVSMIDMFSILVIYLLMNFSASGEIFFLSKDLKLPEALHAKPLESAPLITITTKGVLLETEKVGDTEFRVEDNQASYPQLSEGLRHLKKMIEAERPDQPFKGRINIQADQDIPIMHVKKVMQTCVLEGWTGIHFAVTPME